MKFYFVLIDVFFVRFQLCFVVCNLVLVELFRSFGKIVELCFLFVRHHAVFVAVYLYSATHKGRFLVYSVKQEFLHQ